METTNATARQDGVSDSQSLSSYQQSESKRTDKKAKKSKKEGGDAEASALAAEKRKVKVLKEALREAKTSQEQLTEENKILQAANEKLDKELAEKKQSYQELFEENHQLHDSMLVLQQKMADEMGVNASIDMVDTRLSSVPESAPANGGDVAKPSEAQVETSASSAG